MLFNISNFPIIYLQGPCNQRAGATSTFLLNKENVWQNGSSDSERVLPLHLLLHKQLVPLMYTIANLENASGKVFSCALDNQKTKISHPAPTTEEAPGNTKYSTIWPPHFPNRCAGPDLIVNFMKQSHRSQKLNSKGTSHKNEY